MSGGERLGIFGGTFDPVHLAHLRAALEAAEELELDRVLFMPCAEAPHGKVIGASVEHRLAMLELAVADNPRFAVYDLEARLGGVSYTVRTLEHVRREHPGAQIFFLIGADAFFHLHTWRQPLKLFALTDFVVLARPKSPRGGILGYLQAKLDKSFYRDQQGWARLPGAGGAKRVDTTLLSISSTRLRRRAAEGRALTYLVPPAVEDYIKRMSLYRNSEGSP